MNLNVINLSHRIDRWLHMCMTFNGYSLARFNALTHPQGGWVGCMKSHAALLEQLMKEDDSGMYTVLEDDCTILCPRDEFDTKWAKYQLFLKQREGEWDLFTLGGIYVEPVRIVCRDPFVIECNWSVAIHFVVHSGRSAKTMIDYAAKDKWDTTCDNHLSRSHRGRIWIAYPMMCGWMRSASDISEEYQDRCSAAFDVSIKNLDEFVKEQS